jgi:transposase
VGHEVTEVSQPDKAVRRRRGKTDVIDAEAAARAVLSGRATATAKASDGPVDMLRLLKLAKGSAIKSRTQAINQLKSVLVSADAALRESLAGLSNPRLFKRCTELDDPETAGPTGTARHVLKLLARRIQHLTGEIDDLNKRIAEGVEASVPGLLDVSGVGPDSAAALLISAGDNPERLINEAAFAALCGTSPVEASSGKTQRRRLNRGGDRQANAALYRIVLSRLRWDDRSQDYLRRRLAEGKTRREIIRCLKRYVAREIYRLITPSERLLPTGPGWSRELTSIGASTSPRPCRSFQGQGGAKGQAVVEHPIGFESRVPGADRRHAGAEAPLGVRRYRTGEHGSSRAPRHSCDHPLSTRVGAGDLSRRPTEPELRCAVSLPASV